MATVDLVVTEFILLAIICIALMRYYTGPHVQIDVIASVYLSWVLGLSGILLLPYDISVAIVDHAHSNILDEVWRFVYWSTFSLAWMILPMQMEYHNSGHFTFAEKMKDAFRRNFIMACLAVVAALAYMIYLLSTTGLSPSEVVGFMMALNNTYGVFLIILLMGSGLAALPRRLWQMGDDKQELRRLYISANGVEGAYQDARYALEDCESEVQAVVEAVESRLGTSLGVDPICVSHVRTLQLKVENFQFAGRSNSKQHLRSALQSQSSTAGSKSSGGSGRSSHAAGLMSSSSTAAAVSLEKPYLVDLHARLIRAQIRAGSSERRWKLLAQHISAVENHASDLAASSEDWLEMKIEMSASSNTGGLLASLSTRALQLMRSYLCCCVAPRQFNAAVHSAYVFLSRWRHVIYRVLSVLAGLLSIIILWSELVLSTSLHSPIGMLIGAYSGGDSATTQSNSTTTNGTSAYVQFVCFLTLAYMSLCTYWSLFRLNLGWAYTLQGSQQSSPSSLIYNGEYFSRLQFPLGYNFLMTLNAPILKSTSFSGMMSNIQLVPLFGTSFTVFVPMLMILFALFASLNLLPRMLSWIGVETEDPVGGPMFPCLTNWFAPPPPLSGDDLHKYESGRVLVVNELKQTSLLKMIASGGSATGSITGGISMSRGGVALSGSSSGSQPASRNQHTPYTRNDNNYSRGSLSASSNSYLLDDDEPQRVDDDFNDYERGPPLRLSPATGGPAGLSAGASLGKYGGRVPGQESLLERTNRSEEPTGTFFGFNFSSYFKVNSSEGSDDVSSSQRTPSTSAPSSYSAFPTISADRSAQNNGYGFSGGSSASRGGVFALPTADDDDEDLGGRYS